MSRDLTAAEELYERLETLSKELEGSDRIDAHENRDAYPTILDAMNFVCAQASPAPTALEVHLGDMRESNGRVTWIVTLCRAGQSVFEGYQVYADAIKGRAEYEAAALKHLLGQGPKPDLLAFDTDPPKASPAPEPVARLYSDLANRLANQPVDAWRFDGVESTIVLGALIRAERVTALEQRAETAEHDLQILTTVVRTGYPPPRAIPMRESAEGAAKIAVERAERVKELEGLLREALPKIGERSVLQMQRGEVTIYERIRAALGGG